MKTKHFLALAALLASQIHAAPLATFAGPLTATPSGTPREVNFNLPLAGDTQNCVINISYGDKPGVGPQNDGDTHINGGKSLARVRTYTFDGTYTFTAKAVSGCTGDARVTFTVGNPRPAAATMPVGTQKTPGAAAPVTPAGALPVNTNVGSANTNLTIAPLPPTRITKLEAPTKLNPGESLIVKVWGTGNEAKCQSQVSVFKQIAGGSAFGPYKTGVVQIKTGGWPRVNNFTAMEAGHYMVSVQVTAPTFDETNACLNNQAVPGQSTMVYVGQDIAK